MSFSEVKSDKQQCSVVAVSRHVSVTLNYSRIRPCTERQAAVQRGLQCEHSREISSSPECRLRKSHQCDGCNKH